MKRHTVYRLNKKHYIFTKSESLLYVNESNNILLTAIHIRDKRRETEE